MCVSNYQDLSCLSSRSDMKTLNFLFTEFVNANDQHQSRDMGNADSRIKEATEKVEQIALEKENLKEVYQKSLDQKEDEHKHKIKDLEQKLQSCLATKENEIKNKVEAAKKEQILK